MSELVVIQLTVPQLQTMLDKAVEKAALAAANASGELWGVADLAAHYKVTPQTIYNWERQGRLPRRTAGARWRKCAAMGCRPGRANIGPTKRRNMLIHIDTSCLPRAPQTKFGLSKNHPLL